MKKLLGAAICCLVTACTTNYHQKLDQRLAGKPPEQRRAILAEACGAEIAKVASGTRVGDDADAAAMRRICEEGTGLPVPTSP